MSKKYLIDTSIILDDVSNLVYLSQSGENSLYLSEVVIDELDSKKDLNNETGFFAREFFRSINTDNCEINSEKNNDFVIKIDFEKDDSKIEIHIIFREYYQTQNLSHSLNDTKLIEIAKDYDLILLTNDISLKLRAISRCVKSHTLRRDRVENPNDIDFWHRYQVHKDSDLNELESSDTFKALPDFSLLEIDETDNTQNSVYLTGKKHFAIKLNHHVEMLDLDKIIELNAPYVTPSNLEQKMLYALLLHKQNTITIATGKTGSGKTLIALQAGISLVKLGLVEGIIYMRNTITANDKEAELGFRKGDEDQKLNYFMYPLFSAINFTIESLKRDSLAKKIEYRGDSKGIFKEEGTQYFLAKHNIEVVDIAHARGITLENKFIIFDEVQNASNATIKLIGTRVGQGSRIVFLGDWAQIDHPYLSKFRNGALSLLQKALNRDAISGIVLHQTIRSSVAKWFDAEF